MTLWYEKLSLDGIRLVFSQIDEHYSLLGISIAKACSIGVTHRGCANKAQLFLSPVTSRASKKKALRFCPADDGRMNRDVN